MDGSRFLVSAQDNGDPAFTFRSIFLGTASTALSSAITMLYQFKPVQIQVSFTFIQRKLRIIQTLHKAVILNFVVLIYIFGEAWALFTPKLDRIRNKRLQKALRFLNFGQPFGIKGISQTQTGANKHGHHYFHRWSVLLWKYILVVDSHRGGSVYPALSSP